MIFLHFFQVNTLFLHQSYLKSPLPSQMNLIKHARNHFLLLKKIQKYRKFSALISLPKSIPSGTDCQIGCEKACYYHYYTVCFCRFVRENCSNLQFKGLMTIGALGNSMAAKTEVTLIIC